MNYTVGLDDEPAAVLRRLSPLPKAQVNRVLRRLANGPDNRIDLELVNGDGIWRATAGKRWRVLFEVRPGRHIQVRHIRPRASAYDDFEHPGPQEVGEPDLPYQAIPAEVEA